MVVLSTISALVLIYLSPAIQIDILKLFLSAFFPLKNPDLVTFPLLWDCSLASGS